MQAQELISSSEAAKILGLSGEYFRQLTIAGQIPSIKIQPIGYRAFTRESVDRFKAQRDKAGLGRK